jgi:hypothetical protein
MKTLLFLLIISAGVCSAQRYATDTQLANEAATRSTADAGKAGTSGQGVVAASFRTALGLATTQSPTWAGILSTPISGSTGSFTTLAASGTTSLALTTISSPTFPPLDVIRTTAGTSGIMGAAAFTAASTGDVIDGFGANISLGISDSGVARTGLGTIAVVRAGADNTGNLVLSTTQSGASVEGLRIINGKVLIGSAADAGVAKLQVTGNGSFTGTLSVAGQTQLGASQLATDANSAMSRKLVDHSRRRRYSYSINNFTGIVPESYLGGASILGSITKMQANSGLTLGGYATAKAGQFFTGSKGTDRDVVDFSKPLAITFDINSVSTAGAAGESRYLWPVATGYTNGRLTTKGLGFLLENNLIYGCTHDGTTHRMTTGITCGTGNKNHSLRAESNGAGSVDFYVNGVLLQTLAGPTGTQNSASVMAINVECTVAGFSQWVSIGQFTLEGDM